MKGVLRAGRRALLRHPIQLLLAVAGVAVGVAVVVAVDLANASAREAMRLSVERVAGSASHQIVAGPQGSAPALYRRLRVELGIQRAAPVVEGGVTVPSAGDRPLTLLGLDPFAEGPFRGYLDIGGGGGDGGDITDLLVTGDRVVLAAEEARRLGVARGDTMRLRTPAGLREVVVESVVDGSGLDLSGLAFADIATAQELLGRGDRLTRIDLILNDAQVAAVRDILPAAAILVPAAARGNALTEMSAAFQLNLTALSLLALIVGLFLVFNTVSFLVVQRRPMIGTLRALGVTRGQVLAQVLADAALIGVLGTLIGLPLGVLLATGLTELVLQTVNDLYFQAVGGLRYQPWSLAKGTALGLVGTVLAALPAAREAASVAPRQALSRSDLETKARRGARWMALAGVVSLAAGSALLLVLPGLVAGFTGLFAVIIGTALLVPRATVVVGHAVARVAARSATGRLAAGGAVASLSRTGVAVAALAVAVSAVIGVAVMIDSFRGSVVDWLKQSLRADFYVSTPGLLSPPLADRLAAVEGVDFVTRSRHYRLPTADGFTQLWALDLPRSVWAGFDLRQGDANDAWRKFQNERAVLVSEPYAYDNGLGVGDELRLRTAQGERAFQVAGVFRDYAAVQGVVLMRLELYRALWHDDRLSGVGVYAETSAKEGGLAARLESALAGTPGARVRDNRVIFQRSLEVFDRTFVITSVLRLLAAVVAFVGVLGALMALQLDRAREYATLRALGLTRAQLGGLMIGQSGLLGLAAGLFAVPLGVVLAWLLVFVINRRAFGWTMDFAVEVAPLLEGVALAVAAALLAAVYPAWRTARRLPAEGLQDE